VHGSLATIALPRRASDARRKSRTPTGAVQSVFESRGLERTSKSRTASCGTDAVRCGAELIAVSKLTLVGPPTVGRQPVERLRAQSVVAVH